MTGGGFGLTYNATNATDVRTELGARFDDPAVVYGKPLVLFGRVAWAHDFVSEVRGRARQRVTDLRRHGHAALCVVSDLIEPPLSLIGPKRRFVASQGTSGVGGEADMPRQLNRRV